MPSQRCPSCGAPNPATHRYCSQCGAALPPRAGRPSWLVLLGIGSLAVVGLLLACAGLLILGLRSGLGSTLIMSTPIPPTVMALPTQPTPGNPSHSVFVYDDFSDPALSVLSADEDTTSRTSFVEGTYLFEVKAAETLAWAISERVYHDAVVEVASETPPDSAVVAAGVIFHYQDARNFYLFSVANDGYYALELLKDDTWQTLIDWTQSDMIHPRYNMLRVETKGERITLKVNGSLLEATEDSALSGGNTGVAVSSFEDGPVMIRFDNLLITRSP
ncbi:hypothetical protein OSCT_1064 [Oscillochloris trichoides DG-6]|uniref:DUF7577 domain-containing protein n=1 Tax=Oscillochloris trichoides DG-6 TaxID=765420 RepID=E1ICL3_9CHLR|nr:zinc ribbon domain-containing protein [Oscillochloris trichoides]EFO81080.1 hypothetical protein OSCT_1064 [Oscillochloris trichoides DG-6]